MSRATATSAFLIAGALVWTLAPVRSQTGDSASKAPAAAFAERVDVELVTVDVWVADREGNPVTGLGPDDFEVLHDDRPVAISYFTEVRSGTTVSIPVEPGGPKAAAVAKPAVVATEPASGGSGQAAPAHVVVYFDQSRLHPSNYPPLIRGLEDFLKADEVNPAAVLILRQDGGLFIEASFGSTRKQLEAALDRLGKGTPSGAELRAETEQALDAIRRSWEQNEDTASSASAGIASIPQSTPGGSTTGVPGGGPRSTVGGVGTAGGSDVCGSFLGEIQPVLSSWTRSRAARTATTLKNLSDIASFLAGLPGVKTLLYLSDGLETNPGAALTAYAAGFCPSGSSALMSNSRFEDLTPQFLEIARHANSNRVTLHALQATGLETSRAGSAASGRRARGGAARSGGSFEQSQRTNDRRGLELMAAETGGRTVFNQNAFESGLRDIARDSRTYYALAYQPPAGDKGREHRIEVALRDKSLTARYRRGYLEKDSLQWLTERLEGALNLGLIDNPLEVRLGAGAVSGGGEGFYRMPLLVIVPAERLAFLPVQDGFAADIVVRVMARPMDSSTLSIFDKRFQIKGEPGSTGFAQLAVELELPAGVHLTAVGVQDAASREASFVSTTLQVGAGD